MAGLHPFVQPAAIIKLIIIMIIHKQKKKKNTQMSQPCHKGSHANLCIAIGKGDRSKISIPIIKHIFSSKECFNKYTSCSAIFKCKVHGIYKGKIKGKR